MTDDDSPLRHPRTALFFWRVPWVAALLRALALWTLVYGGIVAHVLVVWKWQTPPPPISGSSSLYGDTASASQHLQPDIEIDTGLVAQLQAAIADRRNRNRQLSEHVNHWEELMSTSSLLEASAPDSGTPSATKTSVANVKELLLRSNLLLSYSREDSVENSTSTNNNNNSAVSQLTDQVARATAELDACIAAQSWSTVWQQIMQDDDDESVLDVKRDPIVVGPLSVSSACRSTTLAADAVQWEQRQRQAIANAFVSQQQQQQNNDDDDDVTLALPVSFPETLMELRELLIDAVQQSIQDAIKVQDGDEDAERDADNEYHPTAAAAAFVVGECLEGDANLGSGEQMVGSWLQAGLDAMDRQMDVRAALIRALHGDDIDTSALILDADLPISTSDDHETAHGNDDMLNIPHPNQQPPSMNYLRHWLDSATLHESSILVDWFLDWISGKVDGLDDFLDRRVYAKVPNDKAVGKSVADLILQIASRIPVPPIVHRNKAGGVWRED